MRPSILVLAAVASCDASPREVPKPVAQHVPAPARPADVPAAGLDRVGQPFGCLAGISIAMTFEQAAHAAPGLAESKNASGRLLTGHTERCSAWIQFVGDRIDDIELGLGDGMEARVQNAWGPGIPGSDTAAGLGDVRVYFNEPRTIRAELGQRLARFEPMIPLGRLLGSSPSFSVMGIPILGRPLQEVDAAFAARFVPDSTFDKPLQKTRRVPANEWSQRPQVSYTADAKGVVDTVELYMFFDLAGGEDALRKTLADQLGAPKQDVYAVPGGRATLKIGEHRATLTIRGG